MRNLSKVKSLLVAETRIAEHPSIGDLHLFYHVKKIKYSNPFILGSILISDLITMTKEREWDLSKISLTNVRGNIFKISDRYERTAYSRWMRSRQNVSSFQICFYKFYFFFLIHTDKHTLNLADKYFTQILCCHWHVCTARIKSTLHFQGHAKASASLHSSALLRADFSLMILPSRNSRAGLLQTANSQLSGLLIQMQLVLRGSCFDVIVECCVPTSCQ